MSRAAPSSDLSAERLASIVERMQAAAAAAPLENLCGGPMSVTLDPQDLETLLSFVCERRTSAFRNGQRVFVSEAFLRRRFTGWHVPHIQWHLGEVVHGYAPADMISLPQVNVNISITDLDRTDFMLVIDNPSEARADKLTRLENKLLAAMLEDVADEEDEEDEDDNAENDGLRGAHAFEARADGSLVLYATMSDGDGEPIRIEPHRVPAVLSACGDALARKPSTR